MEDDRCFYVALPVTLFLKCQPTLSLQENITASRVGCVRCRLGMPFSRCGSISAAEDDPRPSIPQLNTEELTANKISVIEKLAYKNKAYIIVLQETHCTTADKLAIPNFSLAGSVLSRKHRFTTFVHEQLEWSLVDQSPEQSETGWLCVDVAGYDIINVCKHRCP